MLSEQSNQSVTCQHPPILTHFLFRNLVELQKKLSSLESLRSFRAAADNTFLLQQYKAISL
jgi:hypothetical protein